jgi:chromosomal replication initiation ATPase DnaA
VRPRGAGTIIDAYVMSAFDVAREDIERASRGPAHVALARQVAMYLHHVLLGQSLTQVAARFGRDRTTVAHACRLVEDRRDDAAFDRLLAILEEGIGASLGHLPARRGHA